MANTIILKRSSTPSKVPTTSQLELGEIAINTHDGKIFIKKDDGTPAVVEIGGVTSVNTQTGSVVLTTTNIEEGTNLYFTQLRARVALSAGTGISYNNSTGVISTAQNVSSSGTPTFAGLTLTGNMGITGSILPSADIQYDLGSPDYQWRDIYVGPGSLYVNGQKVLEDNSGTITFTADADQNIRITTVGAGVLQLGSSLTNVNVDGTLQIASGKNITDSAGVEVNFGDNIDMNSNRIVGLGAPSANTDAATKKYVDDTVATISTSSITQGNSNVSVVDTGSGTVTVTVDGSTALTVTSAGVVVAGNMTVNGTTTTVNSNTVSIADNIVTLNSDATGSPSQNAGIEVERGDEANVQVRWNEGSDKWTFTNDGAVYHPIAVNTDDLTEGSTNQYHTTARARGAISASSSSGVSYNSSTGVISLGSIPNSSLANNSITINGTAVALGGTRTLDTDAVSEGSTNVYFTNARARGAVSAGTGISYNSTTGVITNTITQYTDALARSAVSVSGDLSYNSTTGVISFTQNKAWSALTGTPTTLAGYGIGNAYTKTEVDSAITAAVAGKDNTDEITEGSTNLFFTNARARGAVSAGGSLSYNSSTGVFSYTTPSTSGITEGTNLYYTDARVRAAVSASGSLSYNSTTGVFSYTTPSTSGITEGTNLYYTDARARASNSVTTGAAAYNSSTGVITIPGTTAHITESGNLFYTDARARAAISGSTGISYNSTTGAISSTITQYTDANARGALSFTAGSGGYNSSTGVITIPTNTNQLTNGAGFITGYTETSTLDNVVARGSSTSRAMSTGALTVSGAITATGEITAYFSDANLKKDIVEITNPIEKVMSLRGVTFRPNETALALGITDKEEVGVIAQEVEAVLPQLVTPSAFAGYKTVKYDKLTALLLEAVKAQQLQIDALRAEIAKLGGSATTEL